MSNNIINNKANNNAVYCLFLEMDQESLNNCSNNKMMSIMPSINGDYNDVKNKITNGSIILIDDNLSLDNFKLFLSRVKNKDLDCKYLSEIIKE